MEISYIINNIKIKWGEKKASKDEFLRSAPAHETLRLHTNLNNLTTEYNSLHIL